MSAYDLKSGMVKTSVTEMTSILVIIFTYVVEWSPARNHQIVLLYVYDHGISQREPVSHIPCSLQIFQAVGARKALEYRFNPLNYCVILSKFPFSLMNNPSTSKHIVILQYQSGKFHCATISIKEMWCALCCCYQQREPGSSLIKYQML